MAQQTKRKRRTKHRGNAAGMVETRGRTGRKLTDGERGGAAQVSMNVEDHLAVPLAHVIDAVAAHAEVAEAEVVGLPPAAAFAGYPDRLPTRGRRTLEHALDRAGLR